MVFQYLEGSGDPPRHHLVWCLYMVYLWIPIYGMPKGIQGRMVVHMVPRDRRMVCKDLWGPQMGSQMGSISLYTGVSSYSQVVFWHAKMGPNHGFGDMSKIAIFGLFGGI